eukprot:CAMPEP_0171061834 /NCGR_PEP_ID=MMETSP0766_2-20121228/4700_1 /TAXON_ID=439317 /ORGANISM="Gambierdiscus australes, Strain CAWD 149" /LENGTH=184 /DNA_ID=CAMNT_0011517575 /DNA_START=21 /DNA_END=571 /DNA_ORIENTATION=+
MCARGTSGKATTFLVTFPFLPCLMCSPVTLRRGTKEARVDTMPNPALSLHESEARRPKRVLKQRFRSIDDNAGKEQLAIPEVHLQTGMHAHRMQAGSKKDKENCRALWPLGTCSSEYSAWGILRSPRRCTKAPKTLPGLCPTDAQGDYPVGQCPLGDTATEALHMSVSSSKRRKGGRNSRGRKA